MKNRLAIPIIMFLFFSFWLCGCTLKKTVPPQNNTHTETINLFYGDADNEKMVTEERQITYDPCEGPYKAALEELIKGPEGDNLQANIPNNTKVYGTIKQHKDLIIDLSREFNYFSGSIAEIIGIGSVVNTMTQFPDIERVKILVEGEEYIGPSGEPRGFMQAFPTDPQKELSKEVILYFGNTNATGLVGEKRTLTISPDISREELIKRVLEELIKGPVRQDLHRTIPPEVTVLSVKIDKKLVQTDFSEEMHSKHWGGATGEAMTIHSIANTLTEFSDIEKVKMTVEGQPLAIEHAILEEPVGRNENMIIKQP